MPPVHPIFVHFPLSLFTVAFAADVVGQLRPGAESRALGFWCLILAVVGAAGAVAAGFIDMSRADLAEATHRFVHLHRNVGLAVLAALALLAGWRWRIRRRAAPFEGVGWRYLLSAGAVFALLVFQGWFGGELVYGLGAGVSAAGQGVESAEEGRMRLSPFAVFTGDAHDQSEHAH